jgi:hypothetical protein
MFQTAKGAKKREGQAQGPGFLTTDCTDSTDPETESRIAEAVEQEIRSMTKALSPSCIHPWHPCDPW